MLGKIKLLYILLFVSMLLVCLPRFNRLDLGFKQYTSESLGDSPQYIRYVEVFRGNTDIAYPDQPYSYRPLLPFIASILPFSAMTSLNIINIIFLELSLLFLVLLMKHLKIPDKRIIISGFLFSVSFPVFYYGAVGIIDSIAIFGISMATYFVYKEKYWEAILTVLVLGLGKETIIAVIPLMFLHLAWDKRAINKAFIFSGIACLVYLLSMFLTHKFFGNGLENYSPVVGLETLLSNASRTRVLISFVLSFGLPGTLALYFLIKMLVQKDKAQIVNLTVPYLCILMFLCLFVIAMLSAYADGRFIWGAMIYSCLIIAQYKPKSIANALQNNPD